MKYKELKDILNGLSENQLERSVMVFSIEDQEFYDSFDYNYAGNIEIAKASDQVNDEDQTYFVI